MSRDAWGPALAGLLILGAPAASAQQTSLGLAETESPGGLVQEKGRRVNFVCPATTGTEGDVWGTGTYAYQSAICRAAIHAGVLPRGQAGVVSIVMGFSPDGFTGSTQNGVTSESYASGDYSYTFSRSTEPAAIDWTTNALQIPEDFTQPVTVICQGDPNLKGTVWGTNPYISDSAICAAAVHAGVITTRGGAVAVTKVPGIEQYEATRQFGVTSLPWSAWADAFRVSAGTAGPVEESPDSGRTIRTAGFTGAGSGMDVVPRTIPLAGFTGTGNGADIVERTITTPGWTASGNAQ